MDIFYWPVMDLLLWGFLSVYLQKTQLSTVNFISIILGALIFWDLLNQSQRAVSVSFLEDVWERNLLNIFVTPLRASEFLVATLFLGFIRILLISIIMGILAFFLYHFDIFTLGWWLIPFFVNLLFFGWSLGIFTIGIIFRYGTQAQILAFGFIFIIQPFAAVFYPVSALPAGIQPLAHIIPASYVFEGMRAVIAGNFPWRDLFMAFFTNAIYLVLSISFFYIMFRRARRDGRLMKLE